jgi:hypothetical protein
MQDLHDVAKSLGAVEKLNKLKVKTLAALQKIPSLPNRILDAVAAAVDVDDIKEVSGQFIEKAALRLVNLLDSVSDLRSPGKVCVFPGISSAGSTRSCSSSKYAHGSTAPVDLCRFWGTTHEIRLQRQNSAGVDCH